MSRCCIILLFLCVSTIYDECTTQSTGIPPTQTTLTTEKVATTTTSTTTTTPLPITTTTYATTAPPKTRVVFCASTTNTTSTTTVAFNTVTINDGNGFDSATNKFTAPVSGLYWLHMSVGIPANTLADVRLLGNDRMPSILRRHKSSNGVDTTSRDELIAISTYNDVCSALFLSTDYTLYSDNFTQTTFAGFLLDGAMSTVVAFSLGKSTSTTSTGNIAFDLINVDTSNAWNRTSNSYIVPNTGNYFITLLTGAATNAQHTVCIKIDSIQITCTVVTDTIHSGEDSVSKSLVIGLNVGASLSAVLESGSVYSDTRYHTALMGFLYSPYRAAPVTWSVFRSVDQYIIGLVDPVQFDYVLLNLGNGWDPVTNRVDVPLSGVYYVHMTAGIYGYSYSSYPTKMELVVNGVAVINLYRQSTSLYNYDTRSRAFILTLAQGDRVQIRLPSSYYLYSNTQKIASFSGFRIYSN